jgi:hypothetical protein
MMEKLNLTLSKDQLLGLVDYYSSVSIVIVPA